jgi:SAM-dependent methyltransferase
MDISGNSREPHPGGYRLTDRAARLCGLSRGMSVLDMGCGAGGSLRYLSEKYEVSGVGIDSDPGARELFEPNCPGARFVLADACRKCVADASFDAVFIECALSVMPSPIEALARARDALRVSGALAVSDIYSRCNDRRGGSGKPWDFEALCGMVAGAGFEILKAEDHSPALAVCRAERYAAGDASDMGAYRGLGYMLIVAACKDGARY